MTPVRRWLFRVLVFQLVLLLSGCEKHRLPAPYAAPVTAKTSCLHARSGESDPGKQQKIFFWRVKTEISTVYLLGSIHVANPEMYPLDCQIEEAFQEARTLALEVVMNEETQADAALKLTTAGLYPRGDSLENHVSAETFTKLEARLASLDLPAPAMNAFRPWFVAINLTMAELARLGFDPEIGIDEHFRKKTGTTKRLVSIETVDDQIDLFTSMTREAQEDELRQVLDELDSLGQVMTGAIELWKRGDTAGLDNLLLAPVRREYPELFRKLFLERNLKMATAVENLLHEAGVHFVIVGGGHLVGEGGVVDLLEQRGHSIEQLNRTPRAKVGVGDRQADLVKHAAQWTWTRFLSGGTVRR